MFRLVSTLIIRSQMYYNKYIIKNIFKHLTQCLQFCLKMSGKPCNSLKIYWLR